MKKSFAELIKAILIYECLDLNRLRAISYILLLCFLILNTVVLLLYINTYKSLYVCPGGSPMH